jgi:hypothetical protein
MIAAPAGHELGIDRMKLLDATDRPQVGPD